MKIFFTKDEKKLLEIMYNYLLEHKNEIEPSSSSSYIEYYTGQLSGIGLQFYIGSCSFRISEYDPKNPHAYNPSIFESYQYAIDWLYFGPMRKISKLLRSIRVEKEKPLQPPALLRNWLAKSEKAPK